MIPKLHELLILTIANFERYNSKLFTQFFQPNFMTFVVRFFLAPLAVDGTSQTTAMVVVFPGDIKPDVPLSMTAVLAG